jgi:hypothetical protein
MIQCSPSSCNLKLHPQHHANYPELQCFLWISSSFSRNCLFDFLEIREGGNERGPLVARYRTSTCFLSHMPLCFGCQVQFSYRFSPPRACLVWSSFLLSPPCACLMPRYSLSACSLPHVRFTTRSKLSTQSWA